MHKVGLLAMHHHAYVLPWQYCTFICARKLHLDILRYEMHPVHDFHTRLSTG